MLLSLAALASFTLAFAQQTHLVISSVPVASSCAIYLGPHGTGVEGDTYHLYRTHDDCISSTSSFAEDSVVIPFPENRTLIYVQEAGVDASLKNDVLSFSSLLEDIPQTQTQTTFSTPDIDVIYSTEYSALLSVSPEVTDTIDTYLPRFMVPILVSESATYLPVPDSSRKRVRKWLDNIVYKPEIEKIVDSISVEYIRPLVEYLTGESSKSDIRTRLATSSDARKAAAWLKAQFEENGAQCEFQEFRSNFSPNVICQYAAASENPEGTIILGAHYDSRGGPMIPFIRAPGANDDGSGIASLLGITNVIKKYNVQFSNNITIAAFSGEEQGLFGSNYYSEQLRAQDAPVLLMVQADMLGYRRKDESRQIAFPAAYATTEASLYLQNLTQVYSKELERGYTNACCSDHMPFFNRGFASTQVFERIGPIADPMYHNQGDLSRREGYDFEQIRSIAKVTFSAVLDTSLLSYDDIKL